jgi:hypothetical protein
MSLGCLDLVELLEELAGIKLAIVLCSQTLNGCVNAFGDGSTEKLCQLSSPIHGLLLNFHSLRFIC